MRSDVAIADAAAGIAAGVGAGVAAVIGAAVAAGVGAAVAAGVTAGEMAAGTELAAGVATSGCVFPESIAASAATADATAVGVSPPDRTGNFAVRDSAARVSPAFNAGGLSTLRNPGGQKKYTRVNRLRFRSVFARVETGCGLK